MLRHGLVRGIVLLYPALQKGEAGETASKKLSRMKEGAEQRQIDNPPLVNGFVGRDWKTIMSRLL